MVGSDAAPDVPLDQPVAVAVVAPAVQADLASDALGEPRTKEPSAPPPGTMFEKWWQRSAVHLAVFLVFMRLLDYFEAQFPMREAEVRAAKDVVTIVAGAFGITAVSQGLRRK